MNKTKLKTYAPQARRDFIATVTARANQLGLSEHGGKLEIAPAEKGGDVVIIAGQLWPAKVQGQREQLIKRIQKDGFAQTMEAVAYTWFNRFAALRYMEIHDYLDHGHRVLSNREGGMPEILNHATNLELPGFNKAKAIELKLAGNKDGELYKMLLVAQCNALSRAMPFLFERIDDDSELLLPDNLLRTDSIIARLVEAIPEEDWQQVEIIGWLYQFYISEKKDQVIGKVVKSEDIPAATQLFTPNWIVQYLVQNSVGRLWLMANPASSLKNQWPYYIQPAEQTPEVQTQLDALIQTRMNEDGGSLNPETITMLDPACGSGHILVVAYDILKAIYLERGYQLLAIPRLILENNLYGLDIDDRAAQLAGFALLMKARADDRRLLDNPPKLNVLALQESKGLDANKIVQSLNTVRAELVEAQSIRQLIDTFVHAKTYGSLIQIPPELNAQLATMDKNLQQAIDKGDLYAKAAALDVLPLMAQARVLGMQFDAVVANPPYMGEKGMNALLKEFLKNHYECFQSDLFSAFIFRNHSLARDNGQLGFMSPFVWMFISSYEELRNYLINTRTITTLIQLEYSGFDGATVPICTFTTAKNHAANYCSSFIRLSEFKGAEIQDPKTLEAISNPDCGWLYRAKPDCFARIPGSPIAYWISDAFVRVFSNKKYLSDMGKLGKGSDTGNNALFIRHWAEVSIDKIGFEVSNTAESVESRKKYFPTHKAGGFRKWYGFREWVLNWEDNGRDVRANGRGNIRNGSYYFRPCATWGKITSGAFSARYVPLGSIANDASPSMYAEGKEKGVLALLNSNVATKLLMVLSPTLNFQVGDVAKLPLPLRWDDQVIDKLIKLFKTDYDQSELSWDFEYIDYVDKKCTSLLIAWQFFQKTSIERIIEARSLEESNNRIFIDAYGLQDELSPEVPENQITLARADCEKDCQRLISYAIGCMMGRYSLDEPGLIYAHSGNVGFDATRYQTFPADADGIVPLTDDLWFEDDSANRIREFLLAVWGTETLEENLSWLAESLGKKGNEPHEETIRRYLAGSFFKNHLQTYKKRPIYWLFSSGKQGAFQALVYLHRYHEGTLARMRSEYVVPLTGKIQSRIEMLTKDAEAATVTSARNKLNKEIETLRKKHVELLSYDEKLRHYADMRIKLDLDDGVKVNYGKFGDLLAEVKAVTGGVSDD
ncbi:MAG: BREX-1 system adenine-specific DNA-methyltransferase PglX [Nitrosomonas sp.]|jgi:type II restriction/modification system DNA methylase subunit YeeA|nr:BREX-1 system adenine-specific DNA-methyltransferase PglX [Nitrosomonas sp.]